MRRNHRIPRPFFGWWIVIGALLVQALISGLVRYGFGVYFVYLQKEFKAGKAVLSIPFSVAQAEAGGMLGPLQGWLLSKFGPRAVMRSGLIILGFGLIILSLAQSIAAIFVIVLAIGVGLGLVGYLTVTTTVANWFERKRNMAMAIAASGLGIGGLLLPIFAAVMASMGWRNTAVLSGIIVMIIGLPIAQLMRRRPEDYNLLPDGVDPYENTSSGEILTKPVKDSSLAGYTTREALRNRSFWFLAFGHAAAVLGASALMLHLIPFLIEKFDLNAEYASAIVAIVPLVTIVAQLIGGLLGDLFNKRLIAAACMFGHSVALVTLAATTSIGLAIVAIVIHGIAQGIRNPIMPSIRADYYGRRDFPTIMGISSSIVMLGTLSGPTLLGFVFDAYGSYSPGFSILAIFSLLGCLAFLFAVKPTRQGA